MSRKVWWCEIHERRGHNLWCDHRDANSANCRMVEYQLVPADALVISKDENGQWPMDIQAELFRLWSEGATPSDALDALSDTEKDQIEHFNF